MKVAKMKMPLSVVPTLSKNKSTHRVIIDLLEILFRNSEYVTIAEVSRIISKAGFQIRRDLITSTLMGKDYFIDCKLYRIYKGSK